LLQAKANDIVLSLASANEGITPLPLDENNLIYRAIKLFLSRLFQSIPLKISVTIEKNIPIGAGLAGGSSNAAATLLVLSHYFDRPFDDINLLEMASELGADVAFCLYGGLAIGRGYGEKLQKLSSSFSGYFVLIKPKSISISTPWAYSTFDQSVNFSYLNEVEAELRLKNLIKQLDGMAPYMVLDSSHTDYFWNAFEPVIFKEFPVLAKIQEGLLNLDCREAHLTGSGPTIYALVESKEHGEKVLKGMLSSDWGIMIQGWLAQSINHGPRILYEGSYEEQAKQETIASS
jgi:4-diphosphocytidyl-2-C-methyl-D-erythritol kinase